MQIHLAWNTTSITFYNSTLEAPSWEFQYYVAGFIVHAATKCDKDSRDKWEEQAEKKQRRSRVVRRNPRLGSLFIWQVPIKISRISLKRVEQLVPRATNLAASAEPPCGTLPPSLLLLLLGRTMGNNHWFMAVILVIKLELLASKSVPAAVRW